MSCLKAFDEAAMFDLAAPPPIQPSSSNMIDRPASANSAFHSAEGLAATFAELLAHVYERAGEQVEPFGRIPVSIGS